MKFKVGDKVRIRSWCDMEEEFEKNEIGDLQVTLMTVFLKNMRYLCGKEFTITEMCNGYIQSIDCYSITTGMLERVCKKVRKIKFQVGDKVRVRSWCDMEEEFGLHGDGIKIFPCFTENMRYLCGREITITDMDHNSIQPIEGWYLGFNALELVSCCENIRLADICETPESLRSKIAAMEKQLKKIEEKEKHFDLSKVKIKLTNPIEDFNSNTIQIRGSGEFKNKAFYLSDFSINWELKKDSEGTLCLIPTRKGV